MKTIHAQLSCASLQLDRIREGEHSPPFVFPEESRIGETNSKFVLPYD